MEIYIVLLTSVAAAVTALLLIYMLGIRPNVWVAMFITWILWIVLWRSEVVLPTVLSGHTLVKELSFDGSMTLAWALAYGIAFYIMFKSMEKVRSLPKPEAAKESKPDNQE